jgi:hypothetical protein
LAASAPNLIMQLWQDVDHRAARLERERFWAVVNPANPADGLRELHVDGCELAAFHPLGVELSAVKPEESAHSVERYVRGGDLVVNYADRPAPGMRTQVYWRAAAHERHGAIAAIELMASVQTSLLDSCPALAVRSQLIASEAYQLVDASRGLFASIVPPGDDSPPDDSTQPPQCYLFRLPGRQYSYAEMVHPPDARQSEWDGWLHGPDYRLQLRHELFSERLEKGVLLRARVLGVLLDRQDDKATAASHWNAFLQEALPLTT